MGTSKLRNDMRGEVVQRAPVHVSHRANTVYLWPTAGIIQESKLCLGVCAVEDGLWL